MPHCLPAWRLLARVAAITLTMAVAGCGSAPPIEPLQLEGNMLTVNNRTSDEWQAVEIRLNKNHSVRVATIAAGGRLQVPLDAFVAGFGQRFNYRRTQITDLRLTATLPDGKPLELQHEFTVSGLEALRGKR